MDVSMSMYVCTLEIGVGYQEEEIEIMYVSVDRYLITWDRSTYTLTYQDGSRQPAVHHQLLPLSTRY